MSNADPPTAPPPPPVPPGTVHATAVDDRLDPELRPFVAGMPAADLSDDVLPFVRAFVQSGAMQAPAPAVDGVRVYTPVSAPDAEAAGSAGAPALLHVHGGGFVAGSPDLAELRNRHTAKALGCVVASVEYRLAPEARFPDAVEDCYAALCWVRDRAEVLGVDPRRIAVGGESAGGGLAAALALLARDRGEVGVAFQLLVYPMLDDRTGSAAGADRDAPHVGRYAWTRQHNQYGWGALLGGDAAGGNAVSPYVSPYAAPARAADLAGLPPTFLAVGALDLFVDENIDYARRLIRADVPTELHVYPGAVHGFDLFPGTALKAAFERDYLHALRRAFGRPA